MTKPNEPDQGAAAGEPLRLRPVAGIDVPDQHHDAKKPAPALVIRPLGTDDASRHAHAAPLTEPPRNHDPIPLLNPHDAAETRAVPLNPHYETRLARFLARRLRSVRDWLYLASLGLMVVALIGFLIKNKQVLHLAWVGVFAANILMLVDGILYLMVVPFRDSLARGLGTLLIPPYTVVYWVKHWDRMRKPVLSTIGSFTPIFLVGLAYVLYEESPVILDKVERTEQAVERAVGINPTPPPQPGPKQPSVADQAKQVLGNEANIIENLAQPQ